MLSKMSFFVKKNTRALNNNNNNNDNEDRMSMKLTARVYNQKITFVLISYYNIFCSYYCRSRKDHWLSL